MKLPSARSDLMTYNKNKNATERNSFLNLAELFIALGSTNISMRGKKQESPSTQLEVLAARSAVKSSSTM